MQPDDSTMVQLTQVLRGTLAADTATRRAATAHLEAAENSPGFAIVVLTLVQSSGTEMVIRLAAATLFKNFVRRNWKNDEDCIIPDTDKATIKANLVNLMSAVPAAVQRQLSDALSHISNLDFPEKWPSLLPELVVKLGTNDISVICGVLDTANSIFEQFREAPDCNATRTVLLAALTGFAEPVTRTFSAMDARLSSAVAAGEGKAALAPVVAALRTCASVFYSLNVVDLPEYFEDHIAEWMAFFHKYLTFSHPALAAAEDDIEEGPLEALQTAILDCVGLYADKYDEEFEPFFPTFVTDVWSLLSAASATRMSAPNMDPLVIKAVRFLSAAVGKAQHAGVFKEESTLRALVEKIVVPNIVVRDTDEELFSENPIEFIRRDIEGSDNDTRRRVATDLVRGLCKNFQADITRLCMEYAKRMLTEYSEAPGDAYVQKDAAIALIIALAVKAQTTGGGATAVNELVNLGDFLRSHVLPEMQLLRPGAVDERPIVKAACIKFIATFRNQFGKDELAALLPQLVPFAGASSYVVHTYAASAVERLLLLRDKTPITPTSGPDAASKQGFILVPRINLDAVMGVMPPLFTALLGRMAQPSYPENDYLMKALMRLVAIAKDRIAPMAPQLIASLTTILTRVCANPANPTYNHYMFETIGALMRNVCVGPHRADAAAQFEAMLFPPFQSVLVNDVMEFLPYVFQLLALLMELRPNPPPGESALTEAYKSLLPPLLTAPLWNRKGNVPALAQLLQAYLHKGGSYIASRHDLLMPLLGIVQKLLSTKGQEEFAFDLLRAMVEGMTLTSFQPHFKTIVQLLLAKLQESKAIRVARQFVHFVGVFIGVHSVAPLESTIAELGGPALFCNIVDAVLVPMANRVCGTEARRDTLVGMCRLLTEYPPFFADAPRSALWSKLLTTAVELCEPQPVEGAASAAAAAALIAAGSTATGRGLGNSSGGGAADAAVKSGALAAGSVISTAAVASTASGTAPPPHFVDDGDLEAEAAAIDEAAAGASEYSAAYSRLLYAAPPPGSRGAFPVVSDSRRHLAHALASLSASMPGRLGPLVGASPVGTTIGMYCAAAGVSLS